MHRREKVFLNHFLADHDRILKIVTLPRHERHFQVPAQRQFSVLHGIPFRQEITLFHLLPLLHGRLQVDTSLLVGLDEFRQLVYLQVLLKGNQLLLFIPIIADMDLISIHKFHHTLTLTMDLDTRVTGSLGFQSRTDDRHFGTDQRHSLTLHVRSHQRTVGIVMLQERDQRSAKTNDLVGSDVHVLHFSPIQDGEVTRLAGNDLFFHKISLLIQSYIRLGDLRHVLFLGAQIGQLLQVDLSFRHLAVGRFDKAHFVDLRMHTQGGDQPDIRTFRRLDGTKTAIVRIVYVAYFKAGTLTGQATRPERGDATLVRDLTQRIGLVQELRQLAGTKERIDHGTQRPGIDKVHRSEDLIVTNVHAL